MKGRVWARDAVRHLIAKRGRTGHAQQHPNATGEPWRRETLTPKELDVLRKIVDDRDPALRPLVDRVLGTRLLTDDELEPLTAMLLRVMDDEPHLSQNWLAADHLVGRVESQAQGFWS